MKKLLISAWIVGMALLAVPILSIADNHQDRERDRQERVRLSSVFSIVIEDIVDIVLEQLQTAVVDVVVNQTEGSKGARVETTHDIPEDWNPFWITRRGLAETNTCMLRSGICSNLLLFTAPDDFDGEHEITVTATAERYGTSTVRRFKVSSPTVVPETSVIVSNSASVPSQNLEVNVPAEPLGGIDVTIVGESVTVSSITFNLNFPLNNGSIDGSDITDLILVDGTGTAVVGPVNGMADGTVTFTDVVTFGVGQSTYVLRGMLSTDFDGTDNTIQISTTPNSNWANPLGETSGEPVALQDTVVSGNVMTVTDSGTLTVELDPSSPSYMLAPADTPDIILGVLKFTAANEAQRIERVSLQLSNSAASSSPLDVLFVRLYDGATHVGTGVFLGGNRQTTIILFGEVIIPKDGSKTLVVRGHLSAIGTSDPGTQGALIQVDYDDDAPMGTRSIGQASGAFINATGPDTAVAGVRMFNSLPTFTKLSVPTNNLVNGGGNIFYRFSITADSAGDIGIYKLTFQVATSGVRISVANIYAYTDSGFSTPVPGVRVDGALRQSDIDGLQNVTDVNVVVQNGSGVNTALQIPPGTTRYFEIRGVVILEDTNPAVLTSLRGDAAYPSLPTLMGTASDVDNGIHDDFIWSPNATTTSSLNHRDWTNGYGVLGLPFVNMTPEVLSN